MKNRKAGPQSDPTIHPQPQGKGDGHKGGTAVYGWREKWRASAFCLPVGSGIAQALEPHEVVQGVRIANALSVGGDHQAITHPPQDQEAYGQAEQECRERVHLRGLLLAGDPPGGVLLLCGAEDVRAQVVARHLPIHGCLYCAAVLSWNRPSARNPLADEAGVDVDFLGQGGLAAREIDGFFDRGHSPLKAMLLALVNSRAFLIAYQLLNRVR